MQLSEFETHAAIRIANLIKRRPKLIGDEAVLARLVGMTPYHLARCFQHCHGISLHQYARHHAHDWSSKATTDWVLLAL